MVIYGELSIADNTSNYMKTKKRNGRIYSPYVNTHLERDVADLANTNNLLTFIKSMTSVAARTWNVLVYSNIANEVGVYEKTICARVDVLDKDVSKRSGA